MNQILFRVGSFPLTGQQALVAGCAGLALLVCALLTVAIVAIRSARRNGELVEELGSMRLENTRLIATQEALREQLADRGRRIADLDLRLEEAAQSNVEHRELLAGARAQMKEQTERNEDNLRRFQAARQQMTDEFKAIAGDVLKTHGETFSKQNREQVDLLLKPLGDKIEEFSKGLVKDRAELVEQLRTLQVTSHEMRQEATNLTRALKNNSQVQGAWGEMILTSVLERSGLRKGEHFRVQETHTAADGHRLRTDVEVFLPTGDTVIIDSKVSLSAFETYVNAQADDVRASSLRAHTASLRSHVRTLASKEYHRHAQSGFDFVVMFLPIESAFAEALNADPGLLDFAMGLNVIITTPTTLMSALRTIYNIWQIEYRQKNAEEIAERAGRLYEKVVGFLENMDKVEAGIGRARAAFDEARAQLSTGPGNVLRQIEKLKELGAKTGKSLPAGWEAEQAALTEHRLFAADTAEDAAIIVEGRSASSEAAE